MATLAHPPDNAIANVRDLSAGSPPITRRQSAEAIVLLVGILVVLLSAALTLGSPPGIGQ